MTDIDILERLRTERQLALNADKQIMARSFDMAISEIERLRRANEEQRESLKIAYDEIADKNLRIVNIRAVLDHETFFMTDVQSEKPPNFREMRGIFKDCS